MRLGKCTSSSQLIRSYSICVRCCKYHGRQNRFIFLPTLYQNHKARAQNDCNIYSAGYIAILFRMSKEKSNLYDRERFAEITQIFYSVLFKYMKENSDPKLTLISKLFTAELGFFKSLKLHFDICSILIYNKMSIKLKDLHCRLL